MASAGLQIHFRLIDTLHGMMYQNTWKCGELKIYREFLTRLPENTTKIHTNDFGIRPKRTISVLFIS